MHQNSYHTAEGVTLGDVKCITACPPVHLTQRPLALPSRSRLLARRSNVLVAFREQLVARRGLPREFLVCRLVLLDIGHVLCAAECSEGPCRPLHARRLRRHTEVLGRDRAGEVTFIRTDVAPEFRLALVGEQDGGEELDLLVAGLVDEAGKVVESFEVRDDLERVALVDEELLTLSTVEHLLGVFGNEGVEERVETLVVTSLRTQDAP